MSDPNRNTSHSVRNTLLVGALVLGAGYLVHEHKQAETKQATSHSSTRTAGSEKPKTTTKEKEAKQLTKEKAAPKPVEKKVTPKKETPKPTAKATPSPAPLGRISDKRPDPKPRPQPAPVTHKVPYAMPQAGWEDVVVTVPPSRAAGWVLSYAVANESGRTAYRISPQSHNGNDLPMRGGNPIQEIFVECYDNKLHSVENGASGYHPVGPAFEDSRACTNDGILTKLDGNVLPDPAVLMSAKFQTAG